MKKLNLSDAWKCSLGITFVIYGVALTIKSAKRLIGATKEESSEK